MTSDDEITLFCKNKLCGGQNKNRVPLIKVTKETRNEQNNYFWADQYICARCNAIFYHCNMCLDKKKKTSLILKSRLARHHKCYHQTKVTYDKKGDKKMIIVQHDAKVNDEDNENKFACRNIEDNHDEERFKKKVKYTQIVNEEIDEDNSDNLIVSQSKNSPKNTSHNKYDRDESMVYFSYNSSLDRPNNGPSHLVAKAISNTSDIHKNISNKDILLHLMTTKFVNKLSKDQRVDFAFILELIKTQYGHSDNNVMKDSNEYHTAVPTSDADIRNVYLIGKNSVIKNLPRPMVCIIHNHSYVSVKQCIAHFFGMGQMPLIKNEVAQTVFTSITDSKISQEVHERAKKLHTDCDEGEVVTLLGITWSDDFDPNSSIKSNRGGVWIRTITLISESYEENSLENTYPISIGLKGENHDMIESEFAKELEDLSNGRDNNFFCMRTKKWIKVHFEVIAFLGDQPERRSINKIMLGNSTFGARYLYTANITALARNLPMCSNCLLNAKMDTLYIKKKSVCKNCLQWDMDSKNNILGSLLPKHYPAELVEMNDKQYPQKLSFQKLKQVVSLASNKYFNGNWTEIETKTYLSTYAINTEGMDSVLEHCNKMRTLKYIRMGDNVDNETKNLILTDMKRHPEMYDFWKGGAYWSSSMHIERFCDVIMHLLFLGVTKSSRDLLAMWLKDTKLSRKYQACMKSFLLSISELGLEWCKVITSKSGWVSDNYLGYCRISKWCHFPYSMMRTEDPSEDTYVEPKIPVKHWLLHMCKEWLTVHGMRYTGTVSQLREIIISKKENHKAPPKLIPKITSPVKVMDDFVGSLLSTVSSVMVREVNDSTVREVDREIKIFLTNLHNACNHFKNKDPTRKGAQDYYWHKKYNFLSLLNVPETIERYGPLLNLWEGSNQGEGYLRYAKPKVTDIHSKNWQLNAHLNLLNEASLNSVINEHILKKNADDVKNEYVHNVLRKLKKGKKLFHPYKSVTEVYSMFRRNQPISAVMCKNHEYNIVIDGGQTHEYKGINITFEHNYNVPSLAMNFHNVWMDLTLTKYDLMPLLKSDIVAYLLLLPEVNMDGFLNNETNSLYYIINSEWQELDDKLQMRRPLSPGCKY